MGRKATRCAIGGCDELADRKFSAYCDQHRCSTNKCIEQRLHDSFYCVDCDKRHGRNYAAHRHDNVMSRFYGHLLGPKLQDVVNEKLRAPVEEQQQVAEELALFRVVAGDAVSMYSKIVENDSLDAAKKESLLLAAGAVMRDCLESVVATAKVAADIQNKNTGEITIFSLRMIVQQIVDSMHSVCGSEFHFIAQRFERMLDAELSLPKKLGTNRMPSGETINVDATVTAMDDAIPEV